MNTGPTTARRSRPSSGAPHHALDGRPQTGAPKRYRLARLAQLALAVGAAVATVAALSACDGSDGPATGDSVWSKDVRTLKISSSGGGFLPSPPGSECEAGAAAHQLDVTTWHLASTSCSADSGSGPLRQVETARDLTAAERQELEPALSRLILVDEMTCGADKPEIALAITTAAGTREYRDSFYSCVEDPRPTVASSALDEVLRRLNDLAAP